MACTGCTGCGGCTEPTGGTPNSSHCTPTDATAGYTFCLWPAISGAGCEPDGDCQRFANQQYCLRWVSDSLWRTNRFSVDCTTTYGVVVDIEWEMTFDASGNVTLVARAYLTGTGTVVATIVTYSGVVCLDECAQPIGLSYVSDGGQCSNWPATVRVAPNCCVDCPAPQCVCGTPPGTLPSVLYATFTNLSGCTCLDGVVFTLNYTTAGWRWLPSETDSPTGQEIIDACVVGICSIFLTCTSNPGHYRLTVRWETFRPGNPDLGIPDIRICSQQIEPCSAAETAPASVVVDCCAATMTLETTTQASWTCAELTGCPAGAQYGVEITP